MIKTFVGDLEVIENGIVHANNDQPLRLIIDELEMTFHFNSDPENKQLSTISKVVDKNLIWELTNYTNPLGSGVISPLELGSLNNRKLYASFFVWTPNEYDGKRIINYVIYLGEATQNAK